MRVFSVSVCVQCLFMCYILSGLSVQTTHALRKRPKSKGNRLLTAEDSRENAAVEGFRRHGSNFDSDEQDEEMDEYSPADIIQLSTNGEVRTVTYKQSPHVCTLE